ncbi:recombinase family protein [Mycolicibacterium aichiense]|uniref:recombinase family protein n=1 Tax=Mycolicibacterium aichiense TaxID=1799 RepID=UPI003D670FAB
MGMATTVKGQVIGYARVSTGHQSLDAQKDALLNAGVEAERIYSDKLSGSGKRSERPGFMALLDYVRDGDTIIVAGIDRLGRDAAEVMLTIKELRDKDIHIRSLREGIDTSNATGRMIAGVLASLAELELELQRERKAASRAARKARGLPTGRPKALTNQQAALVKRMREAGEPVPVIAEAVNASRATIYRVLKESA